VDHAHHRLLAEVEANMVSEGIRHYFRHWLGWQMYFIGIIYVTGQLIDKILKYGINRAKVKMRK
jgi:hypothetical protein